VDDLCCVSVCVAMCSVHSLNLCFSMRLRFARFRRADFSHKFICYCFSQASDALICARYRFSGVQFVRPQESHCRLGRRFQGCFLIVYRQPVAMLCNRFALVSVHRSAFKLGCALHQAQRGWRQAPSYASATGSDIALCCVVKVLCRQR